MKRHHQNWTNPSQENRHESDGTTGRQSQYNSRQQGNERWQENQFNDEFNHPYNDSSYNQQERNRWNRDEGYQGDYDNRSNSNSNQFGNRNQRPDDQWQNRSDNSDNYSRQSGQSGRYNNTSQNRRGTDNWQERDNYNSSPRWEDDRQQGNNYRNSQDNPYRGAWGQDNRYDNNSSYDTNYGAGSNYGVGGNQYNRRDNAGYGNSPMNNNSYMGHNSGNQSYTSYQQGANRGKGPKGYQRSDERIHEDINDRMSDDWHLNASSVEVQVKNGDVVLSGTVSSREEKRMAEDLAESISGVKNVENHLRVLSSGSNWTDDTNAENRNTEKNTGSSSKNK